MADTRRNRPNRAPEATPPLTGEISVDDDTAAALALFNSRLVKQADDERAAKRVERATRAKDAAAARVRELESDTKATVEQRNEAAAAYREAVETLDRAKKGEPEPSKAELPADAATPADGMGETATLDDDAADSATESSEADEEPPGE